MAVEKFPVEASHILMFARSIGDDNQIYYDEDYAKGTEPGSIIAPPTFVQAGAQFDPDFEIAAQQSSIRVPRVFRRRAGGAAVCGRNGDRNGSV